MRGYECGRSKVREDAHIVHSHLRVAAQINTSVASLDEEVPIPLKSVDGEGEKATDEAPGGRVRRILLLVSVLHLIGAAVAAAIVVMSVRDAAATNGLQGNSSYAPVIFQDASTSCTNKDTGIYCVS